MSDAPQIPHAQVRAKERYELTLVGGELRLLADRCLKGEGLQEKRQDGFQVHALVVRDELVWMIYAPPGVSRRDGCGTIVTVLPPDYSGKTAARNFRRFKRSQPRRAKRWQNG